MKHTFCTKILPCMETVPLIETKVRKNAKIRNRYKQVIHLTQDTMWESDKNTIEHHIQENQEVRPFTNGDIKLASNRDGSMAKINSKNK